GLELRRPGGRGVLDGLVTELERIAVELVDTAQFPVRAFRTLADPIETLRACVDLELSLISSQRASHDPRHGERISLDNDSPVDLFHFALGRRFAVGLFGHRQPLALELSQRLLTCVAGTAAV